MRRHEPARLTFEINRESRVEAQREWSRARYVRNGRRRTPRGREEAQRSETRVRERPSAIDPLLGGERSPVRRRNHEGAERLDLEHVAARDRALANRLGAAI